MLIYIVSAALCCLFVAETILIAHNLREYTTNPPSSKLVFLAEAVKLVLASSFYASERKLSTPIDIPPTTYLDVDKKRLFLCKDKLLSQGTAMLVFAVPAVCYFITNNLAFLALELMPAHNYILLSDLRIITTCILSYLVLHKRFNQQAIFSLLLLFFGICMGHWATMPSGTSSTGSTQLALSQLSGDNSLQQWLLGGLVMAVFSMLSAVAAVYLEWIMNHSPSYRHETLNLQNIRLYISGTIMNGLLCYKRVGCAAMTSFHDLRAAHWALVASFACMGLVTALVIKRYGNIVKIYASCVASLLAAGISQALFKHPPPAAFYIACVMALVATLQLQKARAADAAAVAGDGVICYNDTKADFCGSTHAASQLQRRTQHFVLLTVLYVLTVSALFAILLSAGVVRFGGTVQQRMVNRTTKGEPATPLPPTDPLVLGQSCHAQAAVSNLVPFEPTCFTSNLHELGCPKLSCSLDPGCSMHNTSCCAYFNYKMLRFLGWFLPSKCLQDEFLLVYGTALGAVRNQSILGHTQDLDVGITPLALQYLELNSTRQELWQHGYSFWFDLSAGIWRMFPHLHHPSPHFQAVMLKSDAAKHKKHTPSAAAAYVDFYMMWQVPRQLSSCQQTDRRTNLQQQLATPWDAMFQPVQSAAAAPGPHTAVATAARQVSGSSAAREFMETLQNMAENRTGTHGDPTDLGAATSLVDAAPPDTCSAKLSQQGSMPSSREYRKYCVWQAELPLTVAPECKSTNIGDLTVTLPCNIEEHLASSYGPGWRSPHTSYHGVTIRNTGAAAALHHTLLRKLAVTAWGSMPYSTRLQRCHKKNRQVEPVANVGISRYALDKLNRSCTKW